MKTFRRIPSFIILACLLSFSMHASAQVKGRVLKTTTFAKMKVPKLHTIWGGFKDTVQISLVEATNLVSKPLVIVDDKKGTYTISTYQFLYKKRGVTEDEQSGKVSPVTSISSDRFKTTPLPQLWQDQVTSQLKKGEELFIFDVIVKDAQGRVMFAPNVHIFII